MRNLLMVSAVAAILGGASAASAADLSSRGGSLKDTAYEAPPAAIWGGLYIGGHAGGLWNDSGDNSKWCRKEVKEVKEEQPTASLAADIAEVVVTDAKPCRSYEWEKLDNVKFSGDDDDVTFIGGLHIGYNWQSGARVFGLEADASFGDGIDYLASLRARLGYAQDNLLLYVTAGVAFAGFDDSTVVVSHHDRKSSFNFAGDSEVGFVVGGGAEYKLSSNWSVGLEGLYYGFGDGDDSKEWERFCKEFKLVHEDDNDLFVIRARLSYHFQDAYDQPLK